MYAQMADTGQKRLRTLEEMTADAQAFQQRVDADVKIEPKDWMPSPPANRSARPSPAPRTSRTYAFGPNATRTTGTQPQLGMPTPIPRVRTMRDKGTTFK